MKGQGYFLTISILLLFFTSLSTAWPWPKVFGEVKKEFLLPRQENRPSSTASATSLSSSSQSSGNSASGSATVTSGSARGSASSSGSSITSTGSIKSSQGNVTSASSNSTRTSAIDPRLPPGGVSMMIPSPTDGVTYIKVGDQVTFQWNYTSLSVTPNYIDVVATNHVNSQSYTIAANQSFEATQSVTWDTGNYPATSTIPFVVATYTLMIYDANSNPTAAASAGYLGAFSNLQFGIYTPQPYVPLNEFRCATCSGASSLHNKQAFSILFGTCIVTVLSFTWFATGAGIFS